MKNLEKSVSLKPVYRLTGNDAMMLDNALLLIEAKLALQMPDLNKAVFTDENFDAEKILLSCQQIPFFDSARLVVVKNIAKIKDSDLKKIAEYASAPSPQTVLVFKEIMGENVFAKVPAEKVLCNKLDSLKLTKIIENAFSEQQKTITPSATNLLIEFCGKDLLRIKGELHKLLFCGKKEIGEEEIKKFVKKTDEYSIFEISTALTYGQGDKAITLMQKMLETMEFPVILGLISAHFRRILYATLAEGTNAEIADLLGVKEFAISKAKTLSKSLSPSKILKINNQILEIDYDIKSGNMNAENAMYFLVFKILEIIKG